MDFFLQHHTTVPKNIRKFYGSKRKEKILSKCCLPSSCCQNVSSDTNFLGRKINLGQSCAKLQKVLGYWLKSLSLKWLLTEQQPFLSQKVFVRNRGQKHHWFQLGHFRKWAKFESDSSWNTGCLLQTLPPKIGALLFTSRRTCGWQNLQLPFSVFLKHATPLEMWFRQKTNKQTTDLRTGS